MDLGRANEQSILAVVVCQPQQARTIGLVLENMHGREAQFEPVGRHSLAGIAIPAAPDLFP